MMSSWRNDPQHMILIDTSVSKADAKSLRARAIGGDSGPHAEWGYTRQEQQTFSAGRPRSVQVGCQNMAARTSLTCASSVSIQAKCLPTR